ncbi:unnamed protein product [Discula destructiva]
MSTFEHLKELSFNYYSIRWDLPLTQQLLPYLLTAILLLIAFNARGEGQVKDAFPIANPRKWFEFTNWRRILDFDMSPREHFAKYKHEYPKVPYWLNSELGKVLILPSSMINEIRVTPKMSSIAAIQEVQNGSLAGFEPIGDVVNEELLKVVKEHLTPKKLGQMTSKVSEEVTAGLQRFFGDSPDWKEFVIGEPIIRVVARASSRVFGGKIFSHSEEWHQVSAAYTKHFLYASMTLRFFPRWSFWFVQWLLPPCILLRRDLDNCRRVIKPIMQQRQAERDAALADDNIEVEEALDQAFDVFKSKGQKSPDPATVHISLSMVAIHTTVDLLEKTLINLIRHPDLVEPLRQEVIHVLGNNGLNHAALAQLELMDSVLKETQRLTPVANCFLNRKAVDDFELSTGLVIPKNTMLGVGPTHMWDDTFYSDGEKFDGYRFLRMKNDSEKRQMAPFVSTSPQHLGFGHGSHACPGRFFAANEVKIMLSHFLLKYEWKFAEGKEPWVLNWGVICALWPTSRLLFRRRQEEIDIDELAARR